MQSRHKAIAVRLIPVGITARPASSFKRYTRFDSDSSKASTLPATSTQQALDGRVSPALTYRIRPSAAASTPVASAAPSSHSDARDQKAQGPAQ